MGSLDKNQASDRLIQSLNFILKIEKIALEIGAWLLRIKRETVLIFTFSCNKSL